MNVKNVLAPVDFSPASRVAVNYAISLARKLRARLTLLHVVESSVHPFEEKDRWESQHRDQAWRLLSALVGPEDEDDLDLQIVTKCGGIEAQIVSTIKEYQADLVVMGTHGRGLFGRWVIGSVTQSLLRKTPVPILTVCRVTKPLALKRILFATDLSSSSKAGINFALDLARTVNSDLMVMHTVEKANLGFGAGEMVPYVTEAGNIEEARRKLADLVAEGSKQEIRIETIVNEGVAPEEILKFADEKSADLILMTIQSKGVVERALVGSTAERVIREAHVPVLSIPAGRSVNQEELAGMYTSKS